MFDGYGRDIVCASVSILVINTLNSLEAVTGDIQTDTVRFDQEKGRIEAHFPENLSSGGEVLLKSLILGLNLIEKQYGKKYLDFQIQEVQRC